MKTRIRRFAVISKRRSRESACRWKCPNSRMRSCDAMRLAVTVGLALLLVLEIFDAAALAQSAKSAGQANWEKTLELARKKGKVVVSIPASTELRGEIEKFFEKRYGIDVE